MIIGLVGQMASGKGEFVRILQGKGFEYITLSSMVREEARKRGIPEEREKLMEVGNSMREAYGAGVLAKKAMEKIMASGHENWVVDGIRNPAEIVELRNGKKVYIVGVHASRDLLIERIMSRGRGGDANERLEILHKIEREWGKGEPPEGQQVGKCMEMVDMEIENEGTLEEFENKIISYFNSIK